MDWNVDIGKLGQWNPVAALALAMGATRTPQVMNIQATFQTADLDKPVKGALDTTIATPTWVHDMRHTIKQPGFAGQIFKPEFDEGYKNNSGIEATLVVQAGPKYVISINQTPLETLTEQFSEMWPGGWMLRKLQSLESEFVLTMPPNADQIPITVTITLRTWQFAEEYFADITDLEAREQLRKLGYEIPDLAKLAIAKG